MTGFGAFQISVPDDIVHRGGPATRATRAKALVVVLVTC